MRTAALFLLLSVMTFACRPAKKVQTIQQAISKLDTTPVIIVHDKKNNNDTSTKSSTKDIFSKVIKNRITFTTFNAKVKIHYEGKETSEDATAFIRLKNDSAMWLSLRGPLGIEGFRVLITKDSVKVMNLLKKNVQYRSINYLQELTDIPFDFKTLQDMVIGNPIFIDSNIVSYKVNADGQLLVLMIGGVFKHLVTLDNTDSKILHSKLDDINVSRNRTCDITFSDYETTAGFLFSATRNISVAEQSKLDIDLNFKQYSFNQPMTFPFNVPKNYKKI